MAKLKKEEFVKALKEMTILEVKELVDGLKEEFGIDPTAIAVASSDAGAGAAAEPTEVKVVIKGFGSKKVGVIKAVREITGLGLMDAKKAVESVPYVIKEGLSKEKGDELAKKLTEAGAEVSVE